MTSALPVGSRPSGDTHGERPDPRSRALRNIGADHRVRTGDLRLGKANVHQLSREASQAPVWCLAEPAIRLEWTGGSPMTLRTAALACIVSLAAHAQHSE